jgi:hypothetical protein
MINGGQNFAIELFFTEEIMTALGLLLEHGTELYMDSLVSLKIIIMGLNIALDVTMPVNS